MHLLHNVLNTLLALFAIFKVYQIDRISREQDGKRARRIAASRASRAIINPPVGIRILRTNRNLQNTKGTREKISTVREGNPKSSRFSV